MTFEEKEILLLKAAETDEGIRHIVEFILGIPNESVFNTLKKYRTDGPMLVLAATCFSVRPKGER